MAKFLLTANYTQSGMKGLLQEGGSKRRDALRQTIDGVGGKLETFYYAVGDTDLFMIAELPDQETAVAVSMIINSAGVLELSATELIEPEAVDEAAKKTVPYRVPGG
ncbi:MAG: GYD domain-containing protein [Gammaproteobacteria bacterium]|nr:GYD domain-containing protein [Gammaproteobacteria bacterium]